MTKTSEKVTKKQALNLINEAWSEFSYVLDNQDWSKHGTDYLDENIAEEKRHDHMRPDHVNRGLTIREAGKLFAVKQLTQYLCGEKAPNVEAYISLRKSLFTAYGLVMRYTPQLQDMMGKLGKDKVNQILNIDYCELIK